MAEERKPRISNELKSSAIEKIALPIAQFISKIKSRIQTKLNSDEELLRLLSELEENSTLLVEELDLDITDKAALIEEGKRLSQKLKQKIGDLNRNVAAVLTSSFQGIENYYNQFLPVTTDYANQIRGLVDGKLGETVSQEATVTQAQDSKISQAEKPLTQLAECSPIYSPPNNTNMPVTAPYSPDSLNASSTITGKTQVEIRNRRMAVSIPSSLAKKEFADVIKEKIKQGANANSQYQSLLEKLVDHRYQKHVEFLKKEMRHIRKGTSNVDFQDYLSWLEKNYSKIDHREASGKFEEEAIDLYIREEIEVQIKRWNVPNIPSHFIGREHLLEHLAQRLNPKENQTATVILTALHGLGGVGKTFLAARYAQLYAETYNFIFWFNAESETTLTNDYRHFADTFHLPIEGQSPENILIIIKNWLEQQSNWLIIYDNAPDDKLIAKFRPAKGGKILITSRKESWNKKDSLAIDVFSLDEARNYIVELTGFSLEEHQERIDELANTLGYLPLALAQACAYISVNNLSLEEYLTLYAESRAEMLADETMPAETSHEPVAITWHITFKAIEKQQSEASVLLESCAFLQGNSIPEFLLKELFAKQQPALAKQTKPFIGALGCLQQYSMLKLISQEKEGKIFSLHNLVQEVIMDTLSADKKQKYLLEIIELLKNIFPFQEVEQVEDMVKQRDLMPHLEKGLQRVDEWINQLKKNQSAKKFPTVFVQPVTEKKLFHPLSVLIEKEICFPLLILSAHGYNNLGKVHQQKELLERALMIQEQYYEKNHPLVAWILNDLAKAYGALGDVHKRKALLEQALVIQEQYYGKEHPDVASILRSLANAYGDLGEVSKKKEMLEQALVVQEQHYGKNHSQVAHTLNDLANAYGALGDIRKEKELLEQVLAVQEQHYGKNHPDVASILSDLATVYGELRETCKKKELLEQALVIQEQYYRKAHPDIVATLNNLANAYGALGDVYKQKELHEQVLVVQEQLYGKNHPVIARILANLANAYGALGEVRKEKELLEQALVIQEQHYGKAHPDTVVILNNLVDTYGTLGDACKQKELLEQVLVIEEQYYGKNHPKVAVTINNLAIIYGRLGDMRKKKELLEQALVIQEQHYGKDHPMVAATINNLANIYGRLGDSRKKKELLEKALAILEQHHEKDNPVVAATINNLMAVYGELGDVHKQIEMLQKIFMTKEQHHHEEYHPDVPHTLNNLSPATASEKKIASSDNKRHITANQNDSIEISQEAKSVDRIDAKNDNQHESIALRWNKTKSTLFNNRLLQGAIGAYFLNMNRAANQTLNYLAKSIPPETLVNLNYKYKLLSDTFNPQKLLRLAATYGDTNDVQYLLKHIKDVNAKDTDSIQRTALHWAVIQHATDCIKLLMAAGADPHLADGQGKTVYDYADNNPDLLSLLQPSKSYHP